ncbi:hypothetical protein GF371_05440 [Candidatus Woesearchaeota archaeon]|nr:hypothetical protein [Candidatus Woesearchaeota archaeon]
MKKLLFVMLVFSLLMLSACGGEKAVKEAGEETKEMAEEAGEEIIETGEEAGETTASLVKDMAKAFMLNVPYKCEYEMEGVKSVSYIKGEERIRTTTTTMQGNAEALIKGDMMYSWNPETKEGFKMKFDKEMKENMPETAEPMGVEALKAQAANVRCSPAAFGEERFAVPTDVQFEDMTEMMRQAQELAKQMQEQYGDMQMPQG